MNLKGMATSDSSIEVWWEQVPVRGKVIAYSVSFSFTLGFNFLGRVSICQHVISAAELNLLTRLIITSRSEQWRAIENGLRV